MEMLQRPILWTAAGGIIGQLILADAGAIFLGVLCGQVPCRIRFTLHMLLGADEQKLAAYAFGDAWHGLWSEISGEHAFASAGANAVMGRQSGAPAGAAKGAAREKIVKNKYLAYCDRETRRAYRSRKVAAAAISDEVNKDLAANWLGKYTEGSLQKVLGKIVNRQ